MMQNVWLNGFQRTNQLLVCTYVREITDVKLVTIRNKNKFIAVSNWYKFHIGDHGNMLVGQVFIFIVHLNFSIF